MNERNLRIRLGIFVVVTLVLLGGLILLFGSLPPLFRLQKLHHRLRRRARHQPRQSRASLRRAHRRSHRHQPRRRERQGPRRRRHRREVPIRRSEVPTLVTGILGNDASIDFVPVLFKPPG